MDMQQVHDFARKLIDAHGDAAEAEASAKLQAAEKAGDEAEIENWRRIRAAVRERRGAHES
jgi:hypothetical protein